MDNNEIYRGERGEPFKNFVRSILNRGNIKPKFIETILTDDNMRVLDMAFTHESANPRRNYEFLEILGDATANETLVWYFSRRFPQINCPEGVNTMARLKIKYGSKKSFSPIAAKLGMWPYISASKKVREFRYSKTLEDVLEAFIGAIKKILDANFRIGVGGAIVYDIIASFMDNIEVSLDYFNLFDAKSRLQETVMWYLKLNKEKHWYAKHKDLYSAYVNFVSHRGDNKIFATNVVIQNFDFTQRPISIGEGRNFVKVESEIDAAEQALTWLKRRGIGKPVPEFYSTYCNFEPGDYMI